MPEITYRRARLEDESAIQALALKVSLYHHELAPHIFTPPTPASAPKPNLTSLSSLVFVGVDECDGAVVGLISGEVIAERRPFLQPSTFVMIDVVAVMESMRSMGIGRSLVAMIERWAEDELGCTQAKLNVWSPNTRAASFYEELGYTTAITTMIKPLNPAD